SGSLNGRLQRLPVMVRPHRSAEARTASTALVARPLRPPLRAQRDIPIEARKWGALYGTPVCHATLSRWYFLRVLLSFPWVTPWFFVRSRNRVCLKRDNPLSKMKRVTVPPIKPSLGCPLAIGPLSTRVRAIDRGAVVCSEHIAANTAHL